MGRGADDDADDDAVDGTIVDFDPANRRTGPRVEQELRVEYTSLDEFVVAYTEDISRGGLFLVTESLLPVGSVVRLNLALPDDGPTVQIIARVAYVLPGLGPERSAGMGMEFLDVEGGPLADQLDAYLTMHVGANESRTAPRVAADILVVNPDDAYRDRAVDQLRRAGHRVSPAAAGLEALGLVLRVPPDLIVSEIDLPTMDGWKFLRLIRERPSVAQIPFLFITRHGDEATRLRAYQAGVDDVLVKPIASSDLVARIDRTLIRAQAPRRQSTRNALRGDLADVPLASVLSFVALERRTGQMLLVRGDQIATLHIQDGDVIHVDMPAQGDVVGVERLMLVLGWTDGQFELTSMAVSAPRTIEMTTGFAIMEHARRTDESSR